MKLPGPTEHDEQCLLFQWAELMTGLHPELKMMFAIPNGGARHRVIGGQMKAEGVKRGVPDVFFPVARGGYHGLFIEMKRTNGGKVSSEQQEWIIELNKNGFMTVVCHGFEKAKAVIIEYLD